MPRIYLESAKIADTHEMVQSLHSRLDAGDFAKAGLGAGALAIGGVPFLPALAIGVGGAIVGAVLWSLFD